MLVIRDEQLTKELTQIAARENRPVEDVLKSMVAHYPTEGSQMHSARGSSDAIQQVRHNAYAKARKYWTSVGEHVKAAMTDEELDAQFGAFDRDGIPRLKHELLSAEPPPGSLAYAALVATRGTFNSGRPDLARRSEELLDEDFPDANAHQVSDEDASNQNPR